MTVSLDKATAGTASATAELAEFAVKLRFDDLPAEVVAHARQCFRDALGCCLFGMTQPWTRMLVEQAIAEGGNPRAGILASGQRTSIAQAVMIGSTAGHGFELDDIHGAAHLHSGSLAVPIVLAFAEAVRPDCSGRDLIAALVAGYEVGLRVGLAATGALFMRGHHFQATCGVFVALASACNMLKLSPAQARQAFGIGGSMAAGLMSAQEGAMVKRLHAGHAAQMGATGAMLAQRGFTGIPNILEAEYGGFLSTLSGKPDWSWLTRELGRRWEMLNVGFKPYATAASIHSPLHALDGLMKEHRLTAADIEKIEVWCSEMAHRHCAWPYTPAGVTAAQMNMPFALSMMATDRAAMGAQFREERLEDPAALAMLARITVLPDELYSKGGDQTRHAARMRLTTKTGQVLDKEVWDRPGSPQNPMTEAQLREKFDMLAGPVLPAAAIAALNDKIAKLDQLSFADLKPLLFPA